MDEFTEALGAFVKDYVHGMANDPKVSRKEGKGKASYSNNCTDDQEVGTEEEILASSPESAYFSRKDSGISVTPYDNVKVRKVPKRTREQKTLSRVTEVDVPKTTVHSQSSVLDGRKPSIKTKNINWVKVDSPKANSMF